VSSLLFLLAAFALSALGTAAIVLRNRQPKSVDAGVKAFSREMRALAPESRRVVAPRSAPPSSARSRRARTER
jgi:hypothetical protein